MVIVFTGNGKGKTTAALGQMVRALGRGKSALMIQFIKGPWRSGEDEFAERFFALGGSASGGKIPKFMIRKMGRGFVGILGDRLPREEHIKAAEEALSYFSQELAKCDRFLYVLDEINVAVSLGLLKPETVLEAVKDFPDDKILIMTGRGAPQAFLDRADLVTEMKEIKHPFQDGKLAEIGIEF